MIFHSLFDAKLPNIFLLIPYFQVFLRPFPIVKLSDILELFYSKFTDMSNSNTEGNWYNKFRTLIFRKFVFRTKIHSDISKFTDSTRKNTEFISL